MTQWLFEKDKNGIGVGFSIRRKILDERTEFQHLELYESEQFGHVLLLDSYIMLTQRENYLYHEMLAHPALCLSERAAQRVAIIGGGDCGTLKEVLRHRSVRRAEQIELDQRVTEVAREYFPELASGADDPRAKLLFEDGIAWVAGCRPGSFDVLLVDSTDPIGPAEGLFGERFYRSCRQALRQGGVLAHQSESPLLHHELISAMREAMRAAGFEAVCTLEFPQPCYPSGWWSVTLAGAENQLENFHVDRLAAIDTRFVNDRVMARELQID